MLRLLVLVSCGTRTVIDAVFGPVSSGETTYAAGLLGSLHAGMILLADRNFGAGFLAAQIAGTRADFLIRVRAGYGAPGLPVLRRLPDGSWLSRFGGIPVRVIDAQVTVTTSAGHATAAAGWSPPSSTPAATRRRGGRLYHERWVRHEALCDRVEVERPPPSGCRSSLAEAGGSLIRGMPGRAGAALTMSGRVGTARRRGPG